MCKAVDRGMRITDIRLLHKSGGKSGDLRGDADDFGRRSPGSACWPWSKPLAAGAGVARRRRSAGCSPRMSSRAAPSRPSRSRRWTAMPCAPPMSRAIPVELRIVGEVPAGAGLRRPCRPGRGGAHLHRRAAARRRRHDRHPGRHRARRRPRRRARRRAGAAAMSAPPGLDFARRRRRLHAGRRLTARDVGLAAAMNRPWLLVHRRPRVAHPADRRRDRDARRSDRAAPDRQLERLALAALVAACGGDPVQSAIAPDDPDALQRIAAARSGVDLLVTTGGASVGEHDLVREALGADGLDARFLADRDAAGQAADGRPLSRHADDRPARQPGLDPGLRRCSS